VNRTTIALASAALSLAVAAPALAQSNTYKILATSKTSTMQKEMQEAGDAGYRYVAVMGGDTAMGGKEVVVLLEKAAGDTNTYSYRLLATSKTSTLQKELQEAATRASTRSGKPSSKACSAARKRSRSSRGARPTPTPSGGSTS